MKVGQVRDIIKAEFSNKGFLSSLFSSSEDPTVIKTLHEYLDSFKNDEIELSEAQLNEFTKKIIKMYVSAIPPRRGNTDLGLSPKQLEIFEIVKSVKIEAGQIESNSNNKSKIKTIFNNILKAIAVEKVNPANQIEQLSAIEFFKLTDYYQRPKKFADFIWEVFKLSDENKENFVPALSAAYFSILTYCFYYYRMFLFAHKLFSPIFQLAFRENNEWGHIQAHLLTLAFYLLFEYFVGGVNIFMLLAPIIGGESFKYLFSKLPWSPFEGLLENHPATETFLTDCYEDIIYLLGSMVGERIYSYGNAGNIHLPESAASWTNPCEELEITGTFHESCTIEKRTPVTITINNDTKVDACVVKISCDQDQPSGCKTQVKSKVVLPYRMTRCDAELQNVNGTLQDITTAKAIANRKIKANETQTESCAEIQKRLQLKLHKGSQVQSSEMSMSNIELPEELGLLDSDYCLRTDKLADLDGNYRKHVELYPKGFNCKGTNIENCNSFQNEQPPGADTECQYKPGEDVDLFKKRVRTKGKELEKQYNSNVENFRLFSTKMSSPTSESAKWGAPSKTP